MKKPKPWNPGVDNNNCSLRSVMSSLEGFSQNQIPWIIRVLENPKSPLALTGAVNLFDHDCIHALLGRGLSERDEAFVIGFTMGSNPNLKKYEILIFKFFSMYIYPKIYKFNAKEIKVFNLGINAAKEMKSPNIDAFCFEEHLDEKIGHLREKFSINIELLKKYQNLENEIFQPKKETYILD
ncbi:hypothetical protein J8281_17340 [Aquimarina sp. U1-2]|uniref:hypothetical protein n=1 Tax=Aquimarina sp. U1-2 TaxID=2823141 RepID=UPI001AED03E1|nr:hypothetical protein [Aquimarina sp. U1-2]MBP2833964.1 hypothetical protein [Aquimarina sp. U1-2]